MRHPYRGVMSCTEVRLGAAISSEESHYSTLYAFGDPAGVVRTDAVDAGFSV